MRLTLRTLLAYLDNMLPEEDAKAIGDKLDTSELASGLIHRIRNSTRKLRLAAPPVDGRGMGSDANTVAEYLDNTLPAESVTDFERVCLESDVHLGEAAACHQILTMVLAQPADVSPQLRERIYALKSENDTAASALALPSEPAEEITAPPQVQTREVPDYLRRRPWNWKAAALVVTLTLLLVLIGLRTMGPFDGEHPVIGGMFGSKDSVADANGSDEDSDDKKSQETDPGDSDETGDDSSDADGVNADGVNADGTGDATSGDANSGDATSGDANSSDTNSGDANSGDNPSPDKSSDDTSPMPTDGTSPPLDGEKPVVGEAPKNAGDEPRTDEPLATESGRFLASDRPQFLSRQDPDTGDWTRIAPRTVLQTGDRFLTLPTYRPQIALTSGVQMTIVGPSEFSLHRDDQTSRLVLPFGRVLLDTAGVAGASIEIEFSSRRGTATFTNPEATLAVQVRNELPPGLDPATTPRIEEIVLHATSGIVHWSESEEAPPAVIDAGKALSFSEGPGQIIAMGEPIAWIDGNDLREIDLRASRELEPLLDMKRPLRVTLLEQANARQVEVSALAIQSLCMVGMFDQAVNVFNEKRQHSYWRYHLAILLDRVANSPADAGKVQAALMRVRESDAPTMYKVMWGHTQEQLDSGGAAQLVGMLESERMDMRVLGIETLRSITGGKTHLYRPEKLPIQQKKPIQDWRNNLANDAIRFPESK